MERRLAQRVLSSSGALQVIEADMLDRAARFHDTSPL